MANVQFPCPACGAGLAFDPGSAEIVCPYCQGHFTVAEIEAAEQARLAKEQARKAAERGETTADAQASGAAGAAGAAGAQADDPFAAAEAAREALKNEQSMPLQSYHCNNCGAEVICDESTLATFCYFCHSPVVLEKGFGGHFRPDQIIPFKITEDEAKERFRQWITTKRYVPRNFRDQAELEHVKGLYFPYWQVNSSYSMHLDGVGQNTESHRSGDYIINETHYFDIHRHGVFDLEAIEEPGLLKEGIDNELLQSIAPYDRDSQEPFAMPYLAGFFAETFNRERESLQPTVDQRLDQALADVAGKMAEDYETVDWERHDLELLDQRWYNVLKPAYILTYRYQGQTYVYALNGVSGKAYGVLPLEKKAVFRDSGLLMLLIILIVLIVGYFL